MTGYAVSIGDEFTNLLGNVVDVAIKVVIFLAIMLLGWFVGRWLHKWLARFLQRIGFDRAVERGGLRPLLGSNSASDITARLVEFAFLLFVLQLAFGIFGPNPVSTLISAVVAWLPKLLVAIVIVVVTAAIAGWLHDIIARALGGLSYGKTVAAVVQVIVLVLGIIAALNQIGVATSVTEPLLIAALVAVAGVIVVGVGGGLIKPMQHRWERILNRAETESTLAAERVRAHRAQQTATTGRTVRRDGYDQPAYSGQGPSDTKPPSTPPTETGDEPTVVRPTDEPPG
jgi:hypothetical protein